MSFVGRKTGQNGVQPPQDEPPQDEHDIINEMVFAIHHGDTAKVNLITARHPQLINADLDGSTPLLLACLYKRYAIVRWLLIHGADASMVNSKCLLYVTAEAAAYARQKPPNTQGKAFMFEVFEMMIACGADPNATDAEDEDSLLHSVFMSNDLELCQLLNKHNYVVTQEMKEGDDYELLTKSCMVALEGGTPDMKRRGTWRDSMNK